MSKSSNRTTMEVDVQTVAGSFDLEVNHGSGSFTQVELKLTKLANNLFTGLHRSEECCCPDITEATSIWPEVRSSSQLPL